MAIQVWVSVCLTQPTNCAGDRPTTSAVRMAATRIAVPVASGWNTQTAAYGLLS